MNFSSRMESTSQTMRIQCPHLSYSLLCKSPEFMFEFEEREENGELGVFVKGKGQTMTYWLKGYTPRGPDNDKNRSSKLLPDGHKNSRDVSSEEVGGDPDLDLEAIISMDDIECLPRSDE